ncbi:hypothetical protein DL93DRAFT_435513 [Clavulina sp. PMI_390]|nr:hypothetical protein DL93DRAFT_435513 [Clavulina sp. PMI_390]
MVLRSPRNGIAKERIYASPRSWTTIRSAVRRRPEEKRALARDSVGARGDSTDTAWRFFANARPYYNERATRYSILVCSVRVLCGTEHRRATIPSRVRRKKGKSAYEGATLPPTHARPCKVRYIHGKVLIGLSITTPFAAKRSRSPYHKSQKGCPPTTQTSSIAWITALYFLHLVCRHHFTVTAIRHPQPAASLSLHDYELAQLVGLPRPPSPRPHLRQLSPLLPPS